ncbi:MAG: hypothetical protein UW04_C0040G0004 [Parcubacteria group bacterium GW2011_GWB1_43_8]|nr:MAG: hypothetical protein UW04_C0040G0004 [Parcubacteria group bacterium GW2011_GWB1_43_8]
MGTISVQSFFYDFFGVVISAVYLWFPAITAYYAWKFWMYYIRLRYVSEIDWVLLEIKLPREMPKSPQVMEIILSAMHQTSSIVAINKYWQGRVPTWYGLEIISKEGSIHFYFYVQKSFRSIVEFQIYAHYPEVEIHEAADYTKDFIGEDIEVSKKNWQIHSAEYILIKEDAYPIKTYVDYKLDKMETEEEMKNDPFASLVELMGTMKEGEHLWYQILIRKTGTKWKDTGAKIVDKIMKRDKKKEGEEIDFGAMRLSPGEHLITEAIERNVSKLGFDVCIRFVYIAKPDKFRFAVSNSIRGSMQQFNSLNLNGFKRFNSVNYVDYFFKKTREGWKKRRMFDAYINRSAFCKPYKRRTFVLNTEELATIYHFPGSVVRTPALGRIESKKVEPPADLPV